MYHWLVGYQKSGNTWLNFILVHLLEGQQTSWTKYDDLIPNWNNIPEFQVEKKHKVISPKLGWVRAHFLYTDVLYAENSEGEVFSFEPLRTLDKGIYIVRNPLDVCISGMRHLRVMDNVDFISCSEYIDVFLERIGDPGFNEINGGDWCEHVISWLDHPRMLIVRYEDLVEQPIKVAQFIVSKLDLVDKLKLSPEKSVELANASNMHKLDKNNFIGSVTTGEWHKYFTFDQQQRAKEVFGPICSHLGYSLG